MNNGIGESSGCKCDTSIKTVERESVKQITSKLSQPKQNMAAPMRRVTTLEKVVNSFLTVVLGRFLPFKKNVRGILKLSIFIGPRKFIR